MGRVRRADADPEVNSSIYVFDAALCGGARPARAAQRAGRALPHRLRSPHRRGGGAGHVVGRRTARSRSASTRAPSSAIAAAELRERINEQHMLAGVTIVDPASTWIEADVELEADVTIHPFTVIRGDVRVARGVEIGPFCVPAPWHRARRGGEGGTFVEVKNSRSAHGRRSRICHMSVTRTSERTRTSPPATSPQTSRTRRARASSARRSGATSGPASTIPFLPPSRSEIMRGSRPDR